MNEILERYLDKILEFEEQGYLEEALKLSEKLQETFSEDAEVLELILLERGKLEFRARADREALLDFIHAYKVAKNEEIYQLIMEAYFVPNQEYFRTNYQNNMKFLEEYPHYRIRQGIKETKVVPLWQDDEWLVYVNTETKEFRILVRVKHELMPKPNDAVLIINEMWMDEIIACEEACKQSWSFMDADIPFVMTYDENDWILFCQLYELSELLTKKRCVFLIDEWGCRKWFDESQTRMPEWIWYNGYQEKYEGILEEIGKKRNSDYKQNVAEVQRYYSGAKEEIQKRILETKPRILFFTSRFTTVLQYHTRDCMQAAKSLGCETELLIEKDGIHAISEIEMCKVLADFKPDMIFCIDHFRFEWSDLIPKEIIYVTWTQDPMPLVMDKKSPEKLGDNDFILNHFITWNEFFDIGYDRSRMMDAPIPANSNIYKPYVLTEEEKQAYACDICFVCHASDVDGYILKEQSKYPKELQEILCAIYKGYQSYVYETGNLFYSKEVFAEYIKGACMQYYNITLKEEILQSIAADMCLWFNQRVFRQALVDWLLDAGFHNIKLWGNGWREKEEYKPYAMGPAENGETLSKIYQASKIVIGNNVQTTAAARAWESMLSGAFYMSNYIPIEADAVDIRKIVKVDEDVIMFYDREDLLEKIHFYLENENERQKMIERGRKVTLEKMTFDKLIERTIEIIGKKLEE